MNEKIKKIIKQILSIIRHPFITQYLIKKRIFACNLGRDIYINKIRYFIPKGYFSIDSHARILFTPYYHGEYNPCIQIGNKVAIGPHFTALSADSIVIDDYALIAAGVTITSSNHGIAPESPVSYASQPLTCAEVYIGKGCWLGQGVIILPGVSLGEKCIVAAGAVVTKSFPAFSMVGGVPAKLLKQYNFKTHKWES
jgi:acetyltransferase-like isoleucine patch superfamily enzyme